MQLWTQVHVIKNTSFRYCDHKFMYMRAWLSVIVNTNPYDCERKFM